MHGPAVCRRHPDVDPSSERTAIPLAGGGRRRAVDGPDVHLCARSQPPDLRLTAGFLARSRPVHLGFARAHDPGREDRAALAIRGQFADDRSPGRGALRFAFPPRPGRLGAECLGIGGHPQHPGEEPRVVATQDPGALRHGCHPRLPHALSGSPGRGMQLGPGGHPPLSSLGCRRSLGGRHPLDLRPDGGHHARRPLGPDRRGCGRGPLSRKPDRRGPRRGIPVEPLAEQLRNGLRQALAGLRISAVGT